MKKGEVKIVTLEHADNIFNLQRDRKMPKDKCWTLDEKNPAKKVKKEDD